MRAGKAVQIADEGVFLRREDAYLHLSRRLARGGDARIGREDLLKIGKQHQRRHRSDIRGRTADAEKIRGETNSCQRAPVQAEEVGVADAGAIGPADAGRPFGVEKARHAALAVGDDADHAVAAPQR